MTACEVAVEFVRYSDTPGGTLNEVSSTRERIVFAAIELMEREGLQALTMRRIAREAGVNTAAVNYHFGTKANLIDFVMKNTMGHAIDDWTEVICSSELSPTARLYCMLNHLMEGIARYPGIVRTHLFDPAVQGDAREAFASEFSCFLDHAAKTLEGRFPHSPGDLRLSIAQMVTAAVTVSLIPELLGAATGKSPEDPTAVEAYISNLLKRFAGAEPDFSPEERRKMDRVLSAAFSGSGVRKIP